MHICECVQCICDPIYVSMCVCHSTQTSTNHFHDYYYSPRHKLLRPSCDFLPGSNCWTLCTVRRGSTSFLPSFLPHSHSSFASNAFLLQTRPKHSASTSIDCILGLVKKCVFSSFYCGRYIIIMSNRTGNRVADLDLHTLILPNHCC